MKIDKVNVYFVRPRWGFVEVVTDTGLTGWGEAVLEGHAKAVLDYVTNKEDFTFTNGCVELPKLPGLGVEVNKELVIEENKTPHNWKNPVWRHADGSVAEW
jgi:L-alanine-DL-glutamate epimerase-like enolase superfamily enzyme